MEADAPSELNKAVEFLRYFNANPNLDRLARNRTGLNALAEWGSNWPELLHGDHAPAQEALLIMEITNAPLLPASCTAKALELLGNKAFQQAQPAQQLRSTGQPTSAAPAGAGEAAVQLDACTALCNSMASCVSSWISLHSMMDTGLDCGCYIEQTGVQWPISCSAAFTRLPSWVFYAMYVLDVLLAHQTHGRYVPPCLRMSKVLLMRSTWYPAAAVHLLVACSLIEHSVLPNMALVVQHMVLQTQ